MNKIARSASVLSTGLSAGIVTARVLEMPPKRRLAADDYLKAQSLNRWWGTAGAVLDTSAMLSTLLALFQSRKSRAARRTALALAALAANDATWALANRPVNRELSSWESVEDMPSNWRSLRDRWEFAHLLRAMLGIFALIALITATRTADDVH